MIRKNFYSCIIIVYVDFLIELHLIYFFKYYDGSLLFYLLSRQTTHSTFDVCGNMSTG